MSENSTPEERTEMPTERRMGRMREEGQIFFSNDLVQVSSLLTAFLALSWIWNSLFLDMQKILISSYKSISDNEPMSISWLYKKCFGILSIIGLDLLIIVGMTALVSSLAVMLQTRWNVKKQKIKFNFTQLNPINGIKRIFSIYGVVNTLKAIVKLAIILPIAYFGLKSFAPSMISLVHLSVDQALVFTGTAMSKLFWKVLYILIGLAIFDYFWGKHRWLKQNKMTKQEVKDERKAVEGDEETRRRIVAKGLQRIMERIRSNVRKADVVITNPTHYAVALKYERESMAAPTVVAKGKDHMALQIRAIATDANVPILERKELARALYSSTEVGAQIPTDLFKAVAEVLAYVYKIKNQYWLKVDREREKNRGN